MSRIANKGAEIYAINSSNDAPINRLGAAGWIQGKVKDNADANKTGTNMLAGNGRYQYLASQYNAVRAAGIIRAYSGSLYLPNDANCFQDSAGTTAGAKDAVVGKLLDSVGTNHATQATAGYKPILRKGAKNLLTYSEQFDNAAWLKSAVAITPNAAVAPDGTMTADLIVESEASAVHEIRTSSVTLTAGSTYTFGVSIKAAGRRYVRIGYSGAWGAGTGYAVFDLQTGQLTYRSAAGLVASIVSVGDWHKVYLTHTIAKTATSTLYVGLNVDATTGVVYAGDGASGAYVWGAQLETGSTASTYVATTSAPASNGIGPWWLDYDGSDDVLAAGAFGAGFTSSTLVRSNYGAVQTTTTAQDLSAGYNMTVDNSGLIVVPDTVSAADLAVLQRYANSLGGYSA